MVTDGLAIIVLSYGSGGEASRLVASLLDDGIPRSIVLVIHNPASPDEDPPSLPSGVEVVRAPRNLGYAGGMNLGLETVRSRDVDLVLLLTHDARLRPGALDALLAAAETAPEFGVLGPELVMAGTEIPFSFGGITRRNGSNAHLRERPPGAGEIVECDWVDGGTMLVRAADLAAVGGFDDRLFAYFEESDLCLRIRRAGSRVGVVPAALADQEPGGAKRPGAWAYFAARNGIAFAGRAAGPFGLLWLTARSLFHGCRDLARAAVRRVGLRPGPAALPWAEAVGTFRGVLDYYLGRWGPPPGGLPGMGDVSNA